MKVWSVLEVIKRWLVADDPTEAKEIPLTHDLNVVHKKEKEVKVVEEKPKPVEKSVNKSRYCWILDNGHGKNTPGKRSPKGPDGKTVLFEYEYDRDIVQRLAFMLKEAKIEHHILVPGLHDTLLRDRCSIANSYKTDLPKLLVSVHGNAGGTKLKNGWYSGNGISTYHCRGSEKGNKMAGIFQKCLIERMSPYEGKPIKDRGVKDSGFYILKHTSMPAVLTENGFFTNKRECYWMITNEWKHAIAEAHYKAILAIEEMGL